jgi:Ca-activated chloride channel family protein
MVRQVVAAVGALVAVMGYPLVPQAAADSDQLVLTQGTVLCWISTDNVPFGGGPMVVCQQTTGNRWGASPYAQSPYNENLPLAVERGTGEFHWDKGTIAGRGGPTGQPMTISSGQTSTINGFTIQADDHRTRITSNVTGHGVLVNAQDVRGF